MSKVISSAVHDFRGRKYVKIRDLIFQFSLFGLSSFPLHAKGPSPCCCVLMVSVCHVEKKKDMSVFAIYAFVITGLYILYMAVTILLDLFGKKGQKKESVEEFNNSDMNDDEEGSSVVDETAGGYTVQQPGAVTPVIPVSEEKEPVPEQEHDQEDSYVEEVVDDDTLLEQESRESMEAYESLKAVQAQMDAVLPSYQDEYRSDDFAVMMAQPVNHRSRILRKFANNL